MDDDRYCHIHSRLRRSRPVTHQSAWKETARRKTPLRPFRALVGDSKTRHCSVLALMSKCLNAVSDYRLVLQRLFDRLEKPQKAISSKLQAPVLLTGQDRLTRPRCWFAAIHILW
jgi:hypothetical protein